MSKTIDNIKCGNYEVVDNQGVSVTRHFTQCLEKEFADLEAKLAENEEQLKEELEEKNSLERALSACNRQNDEFSDMIKKLVNEKEELKQQLAESEKERHEEWKTDKEWKWEWQKVNQKLEKAEQDKISFAIAELEKVKEHFINIKTPTLGVIRRAEMIMYIDNQIKQLKEGD